MSRDEILTRIQQIIRDVFDDEQLEILETTNANDIEGWDSFMHITILEAIQEEFKVKFSLDDIIEMQDVKKIIDAIVQSGTNR